MYYYNRFDYGGCGGNGNNYFSLSHCQQSCLTTPRRREKVRPWLCLLGAEAGDCRWPEVRYHWDESSAECRPFNWTGCGGNSNNFRTREKCLYRCGRL